MIQLHSDRLERLARRRHPVYRAAMSNAPHSFEDIRRMADDVADLMVSRLGGGARGERPTLEQMMQRRGGALPGRLRRQGWRLARADRLACQPRIARQLPLAALARDHAALSAHLRPLGELSRVQGRVLGLTAKLVLALLLIGAGAVWLMVQRGHI
ncbi:hypothetical protein [Paracoccus sp. NSM]|uniref:hypothetical protein n=1 Tax=Paracoccus sp. NSM TaxID=3457784 RepID=UPI004036429D